MTPQYEIWICQNCSCLAQGSADLLQAFEAALSEGGFSSTEIQAIGCQCQGQCNMSATVRVFTQDASSLATTDETWYCRVKPEHVPQIIQQHLVAGQPVQELLHPRLHPRF
jgi:(2Fe-2S) ferredoxin